MNNTVEIRNLVSRIQYISDNYSDCFSPQEIMDILTYVKVCNTLIDSGEIYNSEYLKTMPWSIFNFRYGPQSIYGTLSELMCVVLWNKHHNGRERISLEQTNKELQVKYHIDGFISGVRFDGQPWKSRYSVQIKATKFNNRKLRIKPSYFKASQHQEHFKYQLHRIMFIDLTTNEVLSIDYPTFCGKYKDKDISEIRIADLRALAHYKLIP